MKLYDAAIAATAMARGDSLLTVDGDFDRLAGRLKLIKYIAKNRVMQICLSFSLISVLMAELNSTFTNMMFCRK